MTAKQIKFALKWNRNLYLVFHSEHSSRIVNVRTRKGKIEVKLLQTGLWVTVGGLEIRETL